MEKKVLYTASTFSHIVNFHLPYLERFSKLGWQVHVACGGDDAPIPGADRIIRLPFQKKMASPENFKAAGMLRKLIRTENYSLISTHTSLAAFFTRLAVKGMRGRPPLINTVHGYLFSADTAGLRRAVLVGAERLTAGETDLLVAMNRWDLEFAGEHGLGRDVAGIPGMGVDFSAFDGLTSEAGRTFRRRYGIPEDAFLLVYPAEFSPRKSQRVLIEAMTRLPKRAYLALPGHGATMEECRELSRSLGISDRVIFPGQVADMGPVYAAADAAVASSRSEGLPFNVMEAMYCGLPVAASAVKGHTDLIEDGVTGLLYPYGDPEACAAAVRKIMDDPDLAGSLGSHARESAGQYAQDLVLPQVFHVYARLIPGLDMPD